MPTTDLEVSVEDHAVVIQQKGEPGNSVALTTSQVIWVIQALESICENEGIPLPGVPL